jgi:predicted RNA-binding Zn ribbon-like protein
MAQPSIPGERDHPSLALVNSRHNSRTGPVEHLDSPAALREWLTWRSLLGRPAGAGACGRSASADGAAAAGAGGAASAGAGDAASAGAGDAAGASARGAPSSHGATAAGAVPDTADLAAALELRASLRELLVAATERRAPEPAAVATVNAAAAGAPGVEQLWWDAEHGPERERARPGASDVASALAALAEDAIALLCGDRRADLIACGAPGCVRLLLKDHPRRHWCSTRCGDRVRAARHYRRSRGQAG